MQGVNWKMIVKQVFIKIVLNHHHLQTCYHSLYPKKSSQNKPKYFTHPLSDCQSI